MKYQWGEHQFQQEWASGFGECDLHSAVIGTKPVTDHQAVWALLPDKGEGWVCCADKVSRFDPSQKSGALLSAEVLDHAHSGTGGQQRTVTLRQNGAVVTAWAWVEKPGNEFRYTEVEYLSSEEVVHGPIPVAVYRIYWQKQAEGEQGQQVDVWRPVGSRFCGWRK